MRLAGDWQRALPDYARAVKAWCRAALKGARRGAVAVVLADDAFVRDLNRRFRGKDSATNVLAFPGSGDSLGDVVLAYGTVRREARAQKKSFAQHAAHLVVHGCLHLAGYDHQSQREAGVMERAEAIVLGRFGLPDPYREG